MSARSTAVITDQVRTAVRFPMQLAMQVTTPDGNIEAVTENISANGILFTAKKLPPVGSRIEFSLNMPAAVMGRNEDIVIQCTGRVVRHQWIGDEGQAAVIIDQYVFEGLMHDRG